MGRISWSVFPGRLFQPSPFLFSFTFMGKVRSLLQSTTTEGVRSGLNHKALNQTGKACQEQTPNLLGPFVSYEEKSVVKNVPGVVFTKLFFLTYERANGNCSYENFPSNLLFTRKAGTYLSVAPFYAAFLGRFININLINASQNFLSMSNG